jgi:hypothetical protein
MKYELRREPLGRSIRSCTGAGAGQTALFYGFMPELCEQHEGTGR